MFHHKINVIINDMMSSQDLVFARESVNQFAMTHQRNVSLMQALPFLN